MNGPEYVRVLSNLNDAIRIKNPTKHADGILLHHDNAPSHRIRLCQEAIRHHGFEVLPHPPYSPDLDPKIKRELKGVRHRTIEEAKIAFVQKLRKRMKIFSKMLFVIGGIEPRSALIMTANSLKFNNCIFLSIYVSFFT